VYEDRLLTYAELNTRADILARYLGNLGVKPGVMVGVFVERSLDMIVALLGVLKAGAAFVPMDPTYPIERISFVLQDAEVPVLLTQSSLAVNLPKVAAHLVSLDTDWDSIEQGATAGGPPAAVGAKDLAYIIYTSGSTGQPKGVEIQHCSVVNLLCSMRKKPGLVAADTLLAVTTFSFDMAVLELLLPLAVGAKLVIASREAAADGNLLLARLIGSGATVVQATPITFQMLLEAGWADQPRVKVICGGEPLTRDLADQLLTRTTSLWNCYGPTETTVYSSGTRVPPQGPVTACGRREYNRFAPPP
jgi:amino acid adenylation domain-containing protein